MLQRLDHVNLFTPDLARLTDWYVDVLGMTVGERPPFPFQGVWLYVGGLPVVHATLVEKPRQNLEPSIEHFALTAQGITNFLDHLDARSEAYRIGTVPEFGIIQVNIHDPDGNHIHIDFPKSEQPQLTSRQAAE